MIEFLLVAFFGALTQEVAHWYELRSKFSEKRTKALFSSYEYWLITLGMMIISPIGCWLLFADQEISKQLQFIVGAAFPLIFKKAVTAISSKDQITLGDSNVRDYFLLYGGSK